MRLARNTFAITLLIMLAACAQVGLPTADTFNEKLAVAYGTVTQIRSTATDLLKAKKITPADASNVNAQADNARTGLDIAREISKTDAKAADARLTMVHAALNALQTYLGGRQ